jgi:hypothetical protein
MIKKRFHLGEQSFGSEMLRVGSPLQRLVRTSRCSFVVHRGSKTAALPERIVDLGHEQLPEEVEWNAPSGFQYLWLEREGSATLIPKGWFPVVGVWAEPWQKMFGEPAHTYGIGKEDVIDRKYFDTGVTVTGWSNVFGSSSYEHMDAINFGKNLLQNEIGDDMLAYINEHGKQGRVDSDESMKLFKRRPIDAKTPIIQGYQVSDNTLVISASMLKYDQDSTGSFEVPPLDIFFQVDFFLWKAEGKVIKVIYECPIERMNEDRPLLTAVRELSVWNFYNERAQFKNGTLEVKKV